jgi:hypothetical protein
MNISNKLTLANSPGRIRRTEVWISREEIVLFLLYDASSTDDASTVNRGRSNIQERTGGLRGDTFKDIVHERVKDGHSLVGDTGIRVYLLEHCMKTRQIRVNTRKIKLMKHTLVDVRRVSLLPQLFALLLLVSWGRSFLRRRRRSLLSGSG